MIKLYPLSSGFNLSRYLLFVCFCFTIHVNLNAQTDKSISSYNTTSYQVQFKDTAGNPIQSLSFDLVRDDSVLQTLITDIGGLIHIPTNQLFSRESLFLQNQTYGMKKLISVNKKDHCKTYYLNIDSLKDEASKEEFIYQFVDKGKNDRPIAFAQLDVDIHITRDTIVEHVQVTTDMNGYAKFRLSKFNAENALVLKIHSRYGIRKIAYTKDEYNLTGHNIVYIRKYMWASGGCPSF